MCLIEAPRENSRINSGWDGCADSVHRAASWKEMEIARRSLERTFDWRTMS